MKSFPDPVSEVAEVFGGKGNPLQIVSFPPANVVGRTNKG